MQRKHVRIRPGRVRTAIAVAAAFAACVAPRSARAGITNPDISVLGQPYGSWSDDRGESGNPDRKRVRLNAGETEIYFDAYLNPYARGTVVAAFAGDEVGIEEGYFTLLRGLPGGLSLKGGQYRAGFGRVNAEHPHALPFAERFRVLASYLPGEEAFIETGISLSERIPMPGEISLVASADWLQGDSFRSAHSEEAGEGEKHGGETAADGPRPAVLGRLAGFTMVGERSGLELGLSGAHGTTDAAEGLRATVLGADLKAKLWTSPNSYLLVQGELLRLEREQEAEHEAVLAAKRAAGEDEGQVERVTPVGGFLLADYNFGRRYNVGASYERYQQATADETWDQALGLFGGLSLLEETTAFRLGWERFLPGEPKGAEASPEAVNTVTLRVIFSMGPHKAHSF